MRLTHILLLILVGRSQTASILAVFLVPVPSHHQLFRTLIKALTLKHNVTVVTTLALPNDIKAARQIILPNFLESSKEKFPEFIKNPFLRFNPIMHRIAGQMVMDVALKDESFKNILRADDKYDLILTELRNQESLVVLAEMFDAPVIDVVTTPNNLWTYYLYGNPHDTSYIADALSSFSDQMTFLERLQNTVLFWIVRALWWIHYENVYESYADQIWNMRLSAGKGRPSLSDMIEKRVALVLENGHFSLTPPYPQAPNFISIAGIHIRPPKPLPQELEAFVDEAEEGVIFFTMGSHLPASTILGNNMKNQLLKAFSSVKQRVLWKWDEEIINAPNNIRVGKWFPQNDILAHNKTKLFITHAGFLSSTEATYFGVPVIAIPLFSDQPKNAKALEAAGMGIRLSFENISGIILTKAINEVIGNARYKENAKRLSNLVKDRPQPPLETALYWIDYVMRHKGAPHLRPSVTKLAWYQSSLLDVYISMVLAIVIPLYINLILLRCLYRYFTKVRNGKIRNKKEQ